MRGNDVLGDFVRAAQEGVALPADHGADILAQLAAITEGGAVAAHAAPAAAAPAPAPTAASGTAFKTYRIGFLPTPAMLRTGNDPLLMIRELASLGDLDIVADRSHLPSLTEIDPQASYLSWTFTLITDKDRSAIADVFEFVDGDTATITIEEVAGEVEGEGWGLFAPVAAEAASAPAPAQGGGVEGDGWGLFEPLPEAGKPAAPAPAATAKPAAAPGPATAGGPVHTASIRVDLDKVDRLVNMVGELVITQAMLGQQASGFSVESHPEPDPRPAGAVAPHPRTAGKRHGHPGAAGEGAVLQGAPPGARPVDQAGQAGPPGDERREHRGGQDGDRAIVRSPHPPDPQRAGSRPGDARGAHRRRQAGGRHHPFGRRAPFGPHHHRDHR
ncbi:MAG: hypothetical protein NVV74_18105 [Magnetospirillum sp.]|nr:hypothetical protein [Magnetospirillum sp.]